MIKGFKTETSPLTAKELEAVELIAKAMKWRIGEHNAITGKEITRAMAYKGFKIDGARLRKMINHIRMNGMVQNLCATSKGYFMAETEAELKDYIQGLTARIEAQQAILQAAKNDLHFMKSGTFAISS